MHENVTRSLSGGVYVIILIAATLFSQTSCLMLFGTFLFIGTVEFCDLVNLKKTKAIAIAAILFFLFSFFDVTATTKALLTIATLYISIKLMVMLFNKSNFKVDAISKYVYLIGYIILPIIILTKIPFYNNLFEPKMLIAIFILIWVNDTFAYITGKSFGKHKLFLSISPKKTVEGFVGGILFSLITCYFLNNFLLPEPFYFWASIAIIIGFFGSIGDLIESKFKRLAGVKDSGTIMPGHGGVLDRLDSAIFAAPFIFLFLQIFQYYIYA